MPLTVDLRNLKNQRFFYSVFLLIRNTESHIPKKIVTGGHPVLNKNVTEFGFVSCATSAIVHVCGVFWLSSRAGAITLKWLNVPIDHFAFYCVL